MKHKLIFALVAVLTLGGNFVWAQASQPAASATVKIGYTNMDYILQNMPESKDIQNQINIQRTQLENNYRTMTKEFEDKLASYEKGQAQMSDVIKADKEKELQGLQQRIQEFQSNSTTQLQTKYNQLVNPVMQKIQQNIDAVAKESGYTYVFNLDAGAGTIPVLLYAPDESNITDLVFKKMGVAPPSKQAAAQPNGTKPAATTQQNPAPKK